MNTKKTVSNDASLRVRNISHGEPMRFEVVVQDPGGETQYQVTMSGTDFERLSGGKATPDECVRSAFLFLLDREPKESILRRFDVSVIARYFPEFPREFSRYLQARASLR